MKQTFEIGPGLTCDTDRLVASRLLIQANSGGGKTRTLRRLLEQSHGRLQHLVIDPEGEYHTLREKFDYVLAAPTGGDTVAHPRTAAMLAERLLQLNVSAILDIYELNPDHRVLFVQRFLDALVNAPRDLWHPVLVVLDEAHVYAPEGSQSVSAAAVKAMASRGRKRGFCLVPATQRLSKLSKDVAAECNNKLIGRCTLDVDIKRASEELGFTSKSEQQGLRHLEPGQFFAYGPAFGVNSPVLVRVGSVATSHPEPGQKAAPVPAPTAKVKKVLQQLADLPAEAEEREKSISDLRKDVAEKDRRIKELERERAKQTSNIPGNIRAAKEVPALTDADRALIEKLTAALLTAKDSGMTILAAADDRLNTRVRDAIADYQLSTKGIGEQVANEIAMRLEKASVKKLLEKLNGLATPAPTVNRGANYSQTIPRTPQAPKVQPVNRGASNAHRTPSTGESIGDLVTGAPARMLAVLKQFPGADARRLGALAGVSPKLSTYRVAIAKLKQAGYIVGDRPGYNLTPEGEAAAAHIPPAPTGPEAIEHWRRELGDGAPRRIFDALVDAYPGQLSASDLFDRTGVDPSMSTYRVAVAKLRNLELVDGDRGGMSASSALFEGGH
ncbi:MAG TPA: DUF87 domain-containing protein [Dokdonella sp.]